MALGSSFIKLLERYARELSNRNSKLLLAGVDPVVMNQLAKTGASETIPPTNIFPVTDILGESLRHAQDAAEDRNWFILFIYARLVTAPSTNQTMPRR